MDRVIFEKNFGKLTITPRELSWKTSKRFLKSSFFLQMCSSKSFQIRVFERSHKAKLAEEGSCQRL